MAIRDIMTPHPVYCSPSTDLEKVARMMAERDCGEIPVCQDGRVVGVVTDRDIVVRTLAKGKDPVGMQAANIMTPEVFTIRTSDNVNRAIELMEAHQVRRLPVVDDEGKLVGILAQADLAGVLPESRAGELLYEISHRVDVVPHRII